MLRRAAKIRRGSSNNLLKASIYAPSLSCHFPEYDAGYFKQLAAEQLFTKVVKGYPKCDWQKIHERNKALDCRIYARAANIALGVDRFTDKQLLLVAD